MGIMVYIWLGALVLFGIAEAATAGLVSLWFAGGALAALIASLLHAPLWAQVLIFVVVSAALLAALRPLARKLLGNRRPEPTNADRAIGKTAIVTEEIDNLTGRGAVKISGVEWTARSDSAEKIPAGALVTVLAIEGAKVRVTPAQTPVA